MSKLKELLERATAKTNDCAEAKYVASWAEDILDESGDNPQAVADSMATLINWAIDIKRAAEQST